MRFGWDEAKRLANLAKHRFDFADAKQVFDGVTVEFSDDREDYGEERFITLGLLEGRVVVLVNVLLEDELIHSPNEFFRLSSFDKGKQAFAMLLNRLAE